MQKFILSIFTVVLLTTAVHAQKAGSYPVVVSFNSMCCGVPDDAPIMNFIKNFKKQNRIKRIAADRIGPMGKEGEYYLAFHLKELNRTQRINFIRQLKKIVPTMKDKGSADVRENFTIEKSELASRATISTLHL